MKAVPFSSEKIVGGWLRVNRMTWDSFADCHGFKKEYVRTVVKRFWGTGKQPAKGSKAERILKLINLYVKENEQ